MLNKEILDKINQIEIDPQDNDLFGKIMNKRNSRNTGAGYLIIGSVAVMLFTISLVGLNKFWGVMPNGYTQVEVEAIHQKEANADNKQNKASVTSAVNVQSAVQGIDESSNIDNAQIKHTENTIVFDKQKEKTALPIKKNAAAVENYSKSKTSGNNPTADKNDEKETLKLINPNVVERNLNNRTEENFVQVASIPSLKKIVAITALDIDADKLQLVKSDKKEKEQAKFKYLPREINIFGTAMYNQKFLNGTDADLLNNLNNREQITSTYGFGFTAEFGQIKNIFFQAGVSQLTVRQSVKSYTQQMVDVKIGNYVDPGGNPQQVTLRDTTYNQINGGNSVSNFINIPLTVGMRWQKNRHIIQPQMGIITSFYANSKGTSLNNNAEALTINNRIDRLKTISIATVGGFSYSYIFSNSMAVYINPQLRYSLTNMNKRNASFAQFYSMAGVEFGIKYIIK